MIYRITLWQDQDAGALQLSLAILDAQWEPQWERTVPCGPFHEAEERLPELLDDARRWLAATGLPLTLDGI